MILDKWQEDVLNCEGDIVLCTGRQVGKTTIMARKAAEYMIKHPKSKGIIVSLTEDQAKLIIVMILDYLERTCKKDIQKGKNKPTQNRVALKNGSVVIARPVGNTGDAVRGFTGDFLIIDEASRMPELVWTASRPTLLTTAGKIWMCSTPFGKQGYFYEAFLNKSGKYNVFHISSEEVIQNRPVSDNWTQVKKKAAIEFLEGEKKTMSALQYGQEYMGLFLEDLQQLFPDELIEKCCVLERMNHIGRHYLGVDIARLGGDENAYEIIVDKGDKYLHVESITETGKYTNETEMNIIKYTKIFNAYKVGIDAGAGTLGVSILDHLRQSEIRNKVLALNNRAISFTDDGKNKQRLFKEDLYMNLKGMMERGEILLLDDDNVKLSLKSIQFEYIVQHDLPTRLKIFGNYSHITEGLIRAAWLAKKEKTLKLFATYSNDAKQLGI